MADNNVRLQRYLAMSGVTARRKAEALILAGRVAVNGKVVRELGTKINPLRDLVSVDGEGVSAEDYVYILFNKPKGCVTTVEDDRGRATVMDYLPNLPARVVPVGRLDYYTEGVLLLTNDGELATRLLAPKFHVDKTYHVKVHGRLTDRELVMLRKGVVLDDGYKTQPAEVAWLPGETKHTWLAITIREGKTRQIHRMIDAVGSSVVKLQRVAFGNLNHFGLRVGDARELTQQEVNDLRSSVGLNDKVVSRGRWTAKRETTELARRAARRARDEAAEQGAGVVAVARQEQSAMRDRQGAGRRRKAGSATGAVADRAMRGRAAAGLDAVRTKRAPSRSERPAGGDYRDAAVPAGRGPKPGAPRGGARIGESPRGEGLLRGQGAPRRGGAGRRQSAPLGPGAPVARGPRGGRGDARPAMRAPRRNDSSTPGASRRSLGARPRPAFEGAPAAGGRRGPGREAASRRPGHGATTDAPRGARSTAGPRGAGFAVDGPSGAATGPRRSAAASGSRGAFAPGTEKRTATRGPRAASMASGARRGAAPGLRATKRTRR